MPGQPVARVSAEPSSPHKMPALTKLIDRVKSLLRTLSHQEGVGKAVHFLYLVLVVQPLRKGLFLMTKKHQFGPTGVPCGKDQFVVLCLFRDGAPFLPAFMRHYQALGAKHFFFLDNGSKDSSISILKTYPNVTVVSSRRPYKKYKTLFKKYLFERYLNDQWGMTVDIDEHFDYPYRRQGITVANLLEYLHAHHYTAVLTHMIDLYKDGSIVEQDPEDREDWQSEVCFYDADSFIPEQYGKDFGVLNHSDTPLKMYRGGIRKKYYGYEPLLSKHSLTFRGNVRFIAEHEVANARVADFTAIVRHYRFVGQYLERVDQIVEEKSYYFDSVDYRRAKSFFARNRDLPLKTDRSRKLTDPAELLDEGILEASPRFREWVLERLHNHRHDV